MLYLNLVILVAGILVLVQSLFEKNQLSRERSLELGVVLVVIATVFFARPLMSETGFAVAIALVALAGVIGGSYLLKRQLVLSRKLDPEWFAKMKSFRGFLIMGLIMFLAAAISYAVHFQPFQSLWIVGVLMILTYVWERRIIRSLLAEEEAVEEAPLSK